MYTNFKKLHLYTIVTIGVTYVNFINWVNVVKECVFLKHDWT